ncbi:MAG: Zn-dependent exopeptidase M28 [Chloroflexi bacterium]|nr:Zn-dependent exopeptidase M28 [Chloroflexota bacterium]OJW04259.1 MAG: hypothetical protein BGO39_10840 [Chloroflexi bacterium 54-19]
MPSKRFGRLMGLLVVALVLLSILTVSGTLPPATSMPAPTSPALAGENLAAQPSGPLFTQAVSALGEVMVSAVSGQVSAATTGATAEVASGPVLPQPLPDEPLTLARFKATGSAKLAGLLLALAPVRASRLVPVDYLPASDQPSAQPEQLLALVPTADTARYASLTGLEFTALDPDADTAQYFWTKLPTDAPPAGQTWLDPEWKVLDQVGDRVFFKGPMPLYQGWDFRTKLYIHKVPPRLQVPGLTQACPCPALAEATFAGMKLETPPVTPALTEAALRDKMALVTEDRLKQVVDQISKNEVKGQALNTRYTGTKGSLYAAERLYTYFFALGLNVQLDSFEEGGLGTVASNVVADLVPSTPDQAAGKPVLLLAHYDSLGARNLKGITDPTIPAYGANDNGVGLAGLLEVARLLSGYQFQRPIRFIAFGGEEQGMLGSQNYTHYSIKPASSQAVINIDSFGYNPGEEDWVILGFINHGAGLKDAIVGYGDKYNIALRLEVKRGEPFFRSDDYYFDQTQHEAVVLTDSYNVQSPNNHTANDILANVNFRTSRKVIQLALVSVAEQAGLGG